MEGTVIVRGSISYVSQDPWIFAGTLRDNILFGETYDKIWYERVLQACSLDEVCPSLNLLVSKKFLILHSFMGSWEFVRAHSPGI